MVAAEQRSITYQPALDGLRAVAVIVVLLFHLDLSWMSGGYLGVSVFFTLSGFLITSLLVSELQKSNEIRLARFYGRRARRLLPASIVCLAGAIVLISADLVPDRSGLRWYVFGALFQFANWVPLGLSDSYGELFAALSPTDHFWSLAIEEQFYWLWPVSMLGLFRLVRGRDRVARDWLRRLFLAMCALFVVFAISAPLTAQLWSRDAAYFATWARVPEILAGAVLAVMVARNPLPAWTKWLAPLALAAVVALAIITPAGRGFAYNGGLPIFALVSAALIAGLQHRSATTALLATPPLVFLGRISYGVYLYHWPVFVVFTRARTDLSEFPLAVLRLAVTLAVAVVSFYAIEQPIRERRVLPRPRLALAGAGLAIPLVAVFTLSQVSNSSSFEQASDTLPAIEGSIAPLVTAPPTVVISATTPSIVASTGPTQPGASTPDSVSETSVAATVAAPPQQTTTTTASTAIPTTIALTPSRPVRMLVIGDSTALATGVGLEAWAGDHPELAVVEQKGFPGCGIVTAGDHLFDGGWLPEQEGCATLFDIDVPQRVTAGQPDVVVVITSFWDVTDHRLAGDPEPHSIMDADWRERTLQRFIAYNRMLLDAGAPRVAWVLYPDTDYNWDDADEPADDPARYDVFHAIEREAAALYPGQVSIVDLAAWSDAEGLSSDRDARPDGVHWTEGESKAIAENWLGNQLIQAALH